MYKIYYIGFCGNSNNSGVTLKSLRNLWLLSPGGRVPLRFQSGAENLQGSKRAASPWVLVKGQKCWF